VGIICQVPTDIFEFFFFFKEPGHYIVVTWLCTSVDVQNRVLFVNIDVIVQVFFGVGLYDTSCIVSGQ